MSQTLLILSYLAKAAGLVGSLNVIPGVSPATGVLIFFIASLVKDTVNRIGDFLDNGKTDWRTVIAFAAIGGFALTGLTGCGATALPAQFDSPPAPAPLSATDTKIAETLASMDTPAALLGIETASSTATSLGMYIGIKQTSTMQSDGLLLFGGGQTLEDFTTGTLPGSPVVGDIFTGLKVNASTTQSATNIAALGQSLDGLISTGYSWISSAASSTTNPSLKAYAVTVFCDDVHAVGKGVCDVTAQYATAPVALQLRLPPAPTPVARDEAGSLVYSF